MLEEVLDCMHAWLHACMATCMHGCVQAQHASRRILSCLHGYCLPALIWQVLSCLHGYCHVRAECSRRHGYGMAGSSTCHIRHANGRAGSRAGSRADAHSSDMYSDMPSDMPSEMYVYPCSGFVDERGAAGVVEERRIVEQVCVHVGMQPCGHACMWACRHACM